MTSEHGKPWRSSTRAALCALLGAMGLAACAQQRGASSTVRGEATTAAPRCAVPAQGCACAGNQPPVPCYPEVDAGAGVCLEGTRYCHNGRFGACENVVGYTPSTGATQSALVDPLAEHPRCSDCEPNCYRVIDNFDPADGPLDGGIAVGVKYHSSGAGLTLAPDTNLLPQGAPDGGAPDGGLYLALPEGLTASDDHTSHAFPAQGDAYLLLDQSSAMAEPTQWLYDGYDTGAYLGAGASCANGDASLADAGVSGALRCMVADPELGLGMFRELPFEPYADDQALAPAERTAAALRQIAYANASDQSADLTQTKLAFGQLGGAQPSGDPDVAGSQIPALHAVASGQGMFMGISRASLPDAQCPAGRWGYPCFRDGARPVVVMVTGTPSHNGPDPTDYPYDYNPADLGMLQGTAPGEIAVPAASADFGSPFALSGDAAGTLSVLGGTTTPGAASVPVDVVGCQANPNASDAVVRFDVTAPGPAGSTTPITLSTEGSSLHTALALFDGPVLPPEQLAASDDSNEWLGAAYALGDMTARSLQVSGDTTKPSDPGADMGADYQGSLVGAACGANSIAPDAAFAFDVASASGPTPLELTLDMGNARAVLALYEQGAGTPPRWPARTTTLVASGNTNASAASVYTVPSGAGNEYVTVKGDTSTLGSDYDQSVLGAGQCNPDSASKDAAFKLHLDTTRTLHIDTEGSSFDTVLSLHRSPPMTKAGASLTWTAAQTHNDQNETATSAWAVGPVNGLSQTFEGDTSMMHADMPDGLGCGTGDGCADAVYAIDVSERTTLRLQVSGQGFEPGVLVTRADPAGVSGRYPPFALGQNHSCALSGGKVYCWGADDVGQLGNGGGAGDPDSAAAVAASALTSAVQVAAGWNNNCAVTAQGAVYCWGAGGAGQLGDGASADRYAPVQVAGVGGVGMLSGVVQVACGTAHCCSLAGNGAVACWGDDGHGQLGDGQSGGSQPTPVQVLSDDSFEQIAANADYSCAVRRGDQAAFCWGSGAYGKLGDGDTADASTPVAVSGTTGVKQLMLGHDHACAITQTGRVRCWGRGAGGRLGQGGDNSDHSTPVFVQSPSGSNGWLGAVASGWAAGRAHSCVALQTGLVQCWGEDALHQLGDGGSTTTGVPVSTLGLLDAVTVVSSYDHSCALRAGGTLWCWGDGAHGKLGDGGSASPLQPVAAQAGSPQVSFGTGEIDAAFTQACRSIAQPPLPGCTRHTNGGHSYFICSSHQRTWSEAGTACEAVGYQLADVDQSGENAFLAAQLSGDTWIGAKRASSTDWITLSSGYDFTNLQGQQIWHTEQVGHDQCTFGFLCYFVATRGFFVSPAASDLVASEPYSSSSTWGADDEPSPQSGRNCVMLGSDGRWATDNCALDAQPAVVAGGFAAPPFAGGAAHPFACEERDRFTDVTLDPGSYYVTVKGIPSLSGGACSGPYALQISDLGSPSGGYLGCDDNGVAETTASVIEQTLDPGDYYLVLKGKHASDAGPYQLTVRDVDAVSVNELACAGGQGAGDPASMTFTAMPGKTYYALVKGDAPLDKGPYTLAVRALSGTGQKVACDAGSGTDGTSALDLQLPSGTYYAVVTGSGSDDSGTYRLTLGGANPVSATFAPPSYADTIAALADKHVRVGSVLACTPGEASCDDAQAQAALLAQDTHGVVRAANGAEDVPQQVVSALRALESFDSVHAELRFSPDSDPGFVQPEVRAVDDPANACLPGGDAASFGQCAPGSSPSFSVSLTNPALDPVPPSSAADGAYRFTLHVEGTREGATEWSEDVPVVAVPTGAAPPMTYTQGSYHQDFDSRGCSIDSNTRPSWDGLRFDADVRPDTQVVFYACTADSLPDLANCGSGGLSSGYKRVATLSAGQGAGTPCSVATQDSDCPGGYCSPYTSVCNYIEGASCMQDSDCPGSQPGRCRAGPSAATLGTTCAVPDLIANPGSALGADNYRVVMRLRTDLQSFGDGSRAPAVFSLETQYRCHDVE